MTWCSSNAVALVAFVAQRDRAPGDQAADDASVPGRGQVVHGAGQRAGHPHDLAVLCCDDSSSV